MRSFLEKLKLRFLVLATFLSTVFGGVVTYLRSCSTQTAVVTTQIVSSPANQIAATEAASFVANLFYEGADDPFPTAGAGGEVGKGGNIVLRKGMKEFDNAIIKISDKLNNIIESSRRLTPPKFKIQEGKRAISKKIGHAEKSDSDIKSAFEGVSITQENAEKLIYDIINQSDAIVGSTKSIKIYNAKGQGIWILRNDISFHGFVERQLEDAL